MEGDSADGNQADGTAVALTKYGGGRIKPIPGPAFADRRSGTPARLLALGLLAQEDRLDVGSIVQIAATAIRLLQKNADKRLHTRVDLGRTSLARSDWAHDENPDEPRGPFTRIVDFVAIMMPREHASGWAAPIEVEIERGLSATVYQKEVFKSALLGLAGDVCFGAAEGERLMVDIEGADVAGREFHQSVVWDFPCAGYNDGFIRRDTKQALRQLLRLVDSGSGTRSEFILALDLMLCPRHLVDGGAVREYTLMRLNGIWITGRGMIVDHGLYMRMALPLRSVSIID